MMFSPQSSVVAKTFVVCQSNPRSSYQQQGRTVENARGYLFKGIKNALGRFSGSKVISYDNY